MHAAQHADRGSPNASLPPRLRQPWSPAWSVCAQAPHPGPHSASEAWFCLCACPWRSGEASATVEHAHGIPGSCRHCPGGAPRRERAAFGQLRASCLALGTAGGGGGSTAAGGRPQGRCRARSVRRRSEACSCWCVRLGGRGAEPERRCHSPCCASPTPPGIQSMHRPSRHPRCLSQRQLHRSSPSNGTAQAPTIQTQPPAQHAPPVPKGPALQTKVRAAAP